MEQPQGPTDPSAPDVRDQLVRWARDPTNHKAATHTLLDAGRATPNWIATTPREAFFILGQFALEESKRVWDEPDLGGLPRAEGSAERLRAFLTGADDAGAELLRHALDYGVMTLGFEPDAFIHELVAGVMGDSYPVPARMLEHAEVIVRRYLAKTMCAGRPPAGAFDLFAVEGGTAALCYVFRSLLSNGALRRGDTIACGTPSAAPALALDLNLEELAFTTLAVSQSETVNGRPVWQYPDREIAKLEDPKVKAFFLVNPGNPGSCALRRETVERIVELVRTKRPDLILVTDDVYGPFVEGFRSLAAELPRNTILVYSFSKAFGCTGWRLGVVALHERNVIDEALERLPDAEREVLRRRYGALERDHGPVKFIDRMVADSRGVALSPTAGLSLPQQIQMTLFALFALLDVDDEYQTRCRGIIRGRLKTLFDALGVPTHDDPLRAGYYADVDLAVWGHRTFGDEFTSYVEAHDDPLEILLELARRHGVVLRSGRAFDGPPWTARVSLANLDAEDYAAFGRDLKEIAAAAVRAWRDGTRGGGRLESDR